MPNLKGNKLRDALEDSQTRRSIGVPTKEEKQPNDMFYREPPPAKLTVDDENIEEPKSAGGLSHNPLDAKWGAAYDAAQNKPTGPDGVELSREDFVAMKRREMREKEYNRQKNARRFSQPSNMPDSPGIGTDETYDSPAAVGRGMMDVGNDVIKKSRQR